MAKETIKIRYPEYMRLAMMIGLVLATVYTLFDFFNNWIASPLTGDVIVVWIMGIAALLIIFPLICYLSSLIWSSVTPKPTRTK